MVITTQQCLRPILIDWGVAKLESTSRISRPVSFTEATTIQSVGNPPEILAGRDAVIASDIYMVGFILFYIFSGGQIIRPLRESEYVLDLSQVNPNVPEAINRLVIQMAQFLPSDRIQSFDTVISTLTQILHTVSDDSNSTYLGNDAHNSH